VTIPNISPGNVVVAVRDANGTVTQATGITTVLPDQTVTARIERPIGSVAVTSAIPGEILVNNRATGTNVTSGGTVTIANVNPGNVTVAVREANGTVTQATGTTTIRANETANARIERQVGSIAVTSVLSGAVLVNNQPTGTNVTSGGTVTIPNLTPGNTTVTVRESGGREASGTANVIAGQTVPVRIEFTGQNPETHPDGGYQVFRADDRPNDGFRVIPPGTPGSEFNVIRPPVYENWLISPIYFEPDSATLIETHRHILEEVGKYLVENPGLRLLIRAYTAPFGTAEGRHMVSEWRADFSSNYMINNYRIATNRITTELYGSDSIPQGVTQTSSWVSYRCVELIVY
jgi:outer membrane protein OmpA-like peptidoglycan-associated protein